MHHPSQNIQINDEKCISFRIFHDRFIKLIVKQSIKTRQKIDGWQLDKQWVRSIGNIVCVYEEI
jgi:hypothetical protein